MVELKNEVDFMDKEELEQHYLKTIYTVFVDKDKYDIKINKPVPDVFNQLLKNQNSAAILTAWNPRSQFFSQTENKSRNNYLRVSLAKNKFNSLNAIGQGADTSWPAEESFFVVGINKDEAEKIATEYGQYAYIWLEYEKPVSLEFSSIWKDQL